MTLQHYLSTHGMKPTQFAAVIGVTPSTITRLLRGERSPSLATLHKIARATAGKVTADDFPAASSKAA